MPDLYLGRRTIEPTECMGTTCSWFVESEFCDYSTCSVPLMAFKVDGINYDTDRLRRRLAD